MGGFLHVPDSGDPSDIQQLFPKFNLQILCCRFWWLKRWEFSELSFPYWRVYYNTKAGAKLYFGGNEYQMSNDCIYLIAPNTSYRTQLFNNEVPVDGFAFDGGKVDEDYNLGFTAGVIEHLFIHFNLGMPYDNFPPGVFSFQLGTELRAGIETITKHLIINPAQFDFFTFLSVQAVICSLLAQLQKDDWSASSYDHRILEVLQYIENNLQSNLTNRALAGIANLATNSFTRLFTNQLGVAPQRFVKKRRIDAACIQLHHSEISIDQIAIHNGFANRYHFTRVFSAVTGVSPSRYRKEFGIK